MDWNLAIESKRGPLLQHVLGLFARIGLSEGVTIERVSKPVYREVLGILRTAESAVRRLIIAAARDIVVEYKPRRPVSAKAKTSRKDKGQPKEEGKAKRKRRPLFGLFDPIRRFRRRFKKRHRPEPRIHVFGEPDPRIPAFLRSQLQAPEQAPAAPIPEKEVTVDDGTVSAKNLIRRLIAVVDALRDIPGQARRYALWCSKPYEERHPQRRSALRVGRPPGFRKRAKHEVDEVLKECHWLARNAMPELDTS